MSFWWSAPTPLNLANQKLYVRLRNEQEEPPTTTIPTRDSNTHDTTHILDLADAVETYTGLL